MIGNLHSARRRRLVAFAILAWLNVALLPCTMAIADNIPECPDCPTEASEHMPGHHAGHGLERPDHDQDAKAHCGIDTPDCCDLGDFLKENRTAKTDVEPHFAALPTIADLGLRPAGLVLASPGTGPPPDNGRLRLHLLNCVFRD